MLPSDTKYVLAAFCKRIELKASELYFRILLLFTKKQQAYEDFLSLRD